MVVLVVVVVAAYPNWHKALEAFGSALKEIEKEKEERKREPLAVQILFRNSHNLCVCFF